MPSARRARPTRLTGPRSRTSEGKDRAERLRPRRSTVRPRARLLLVFAGLPATGKSTLAEGVATRLHATWLRVDTVEAALLKAGLPHSFETGLAAYIAVRDVAAEQLRQGRSVVVDAVNGVEPARRMWRELAREVGARRRTVEVTISDRGEHRRRVEARASPTPPLPALSWDEVSRREYEAWHEPRLRVDGIRPRDENLRRILRYCRASARRPSRGPGRRS